MMSMCVILLGLVVVAATDTVEKYTTKYDHINEDEIMASERLVNNYVKCALDKGKCTPDGKELKKRIHDALETMCTKCSDRQKLAADKWFHFLYYKRRADYDAIADKYDPGRMYRNRYEPKYLRPLETAFKKTR